MAAAKQRIEALRTVVDVQTLLRAPGRAARPARILIVLRGLPGSGKSFLAKKLRDAEVEEGGEAPRLHALDDYFVAVSGCARARAPLLPAASRMHACIGADGT